MARHRSVRWRCTRLVAGRRHRSERRDPHDGVDGAGAGRRPNSGACGRRAGAAVGAAGLAAAGLGRRSCLRRGLLGRFLRRGLLWTSWRISWPISSRPSSPTSSRISSPTSWRLSSPISSRISSSPLQLFLPFWPSCFSCSSSPLAIVVLLLPPINVYRAFQVVRFRAGPIDQFNPGRGPPVAQSRSSIV